MWTRIWLVALCLVSVLLLDRASAANPLHHENGVSLLSAEDALHCSVVTEDNAALCAATARNHVVQGQRKGEFLTCSSCQAVVNLVEYEVSQNSTLEAIVDFFEKKCNSSGLPPNLQKACDEIVVKLVDLIPFLASKIKLLGLYDAQAMCSFLGECDVYCCQTETHPEGIHLALTANSPAEMSVMWTTKKPLVGSQVEWSLSEHGPWKSAPARLSTYSNGAWQGTLYTALIQGLAPKQRVYYRVGHPQSGIFSDVFWFRTLNTVDPGVALRFAVVGDMGAGPNAFWTIQRLNSEAQRGDFDILLHVGDISYADGYMKTWDEFFRMLAPVMTRVPYMVVPGNHEMFFNFSAYKHRFAMPGIPLSQVLNGQQPSVQKARRDTKYHGTPPVNTTGTNLYYSYNLQFHDFALHQIGVDTESVINFALIDDKERAWIQEDLAPYAQMPRGKYRPWILGYSHRPLYCSMHHNYGDCVIFAEYLRLRMEKELLASGTDVFIYGHVHNTERTYPVFDGKRQSMGPGSTKNLYHDPTAPVYLLLGGSGNREGLDRNYETPSPDWSATQIAMFSYAHLTFHNSTLLSWELVDSMTGKVLDTMDITRS